MIEQLIDQVAEILECEPAELKAETTFRDLPNWDSLAYMSVISMIDDEFDIVIPQEQFRGLKTIADIAEYIQRNNKPK